MRQYLSRPDIKKKISKRGKEYRNRLDVKERTRKYHARPETKNIYESIVKNGDQNIEIDQKLRNVYKNIGIDQM